MGSEMCIRDRYAVGDAPNIVTFSPVVRLCAADAVKVAVLPERVIEVTATLYLTVGVVSYGLDEISDISTSSPACIPCGPLVSTVAVVPVLVIDSIVLNSCGSCPR